MFICFLLNACTNKIEDNMDTPPTPMLYSVDFELGSANGATSDPTVVTKGIDYQWSYFTEEYPYNYIYIHSADNGVGVEHRSLRIPVVNDLETCENLGCEGIRFQIDVQEDGSYFIRTNEDEIKLEANEKTYFSTIEDPFWTATLSEGDSPLTHSDVFVRSQNNEELLRSTNEYSVNELLELATETSPIIPLSRHCTGFRTRVIFTNYDENYEQYILSENIFKNSIGYSIDHFFIKIYVGPAFCHSYDVYNNSVPENDTGGYYLSRENQYVAFTEADFNDSGETESYEFQGYGYQTELEDILVSPLNLNIANQNPFTAYIFVKFAEDISNLPENFYTSDDGAFWFEVPISGMTTDPNYIYRAVLVYNYMDLLNIVNWTKNPDSFPGSATNTTVTRSNVSLTLRHIDVTPLKIISDIENKR